MSRESFDDSARELQLAEPGWLAGCRGPRTDADFAFGLFRHQSSGSVGGRETESVPPCSEHGIEDCYEPVRLDRTITRPDERVVVYQVCSQRREPIAVSCGAGYGKDWDHPGMLSVSSASVQASFKYRTPVLFE
jgi:hypothetical protein